MSVWERCAMYVTCELEDNDSGSQLFYTICVYRMSRIFAHSHRRPKSSWRTPGHYHKSFQWSHKITTSKPFQVRVAFSIPSITRSNDEYYNHCLWETFAESLVSCYTTSEASEAREIRRNYRIINIMSWCLLYHCHSRWQIYDFYLVFPKQWKSIFVPIKSL